MAEEVQGEEVVVEEGTTTEEVQEEVALPSDNPTFEMPTKFAGKSAEDIAKSYMELEKMKGGDVKSQEEKVETKTTEETSTEEHYEKYAKSLDDNGELSSDEYAELAEAGYDKATVDAEIKRRSDLKEFESYKKDRALNEVLEPLGGGKDKFKEVSDWANQNKSEEEMKEFNATLAAVPKVAQQAMLKQLYAEYASADDSPTVLHTNTTQSTPSKGYTSEADFFKDIGSPDYKTHKSFAKAVEAKLSKTNTEGWSIG